MELESAAKIVSGIAAGGGGIWGLWIKIVKPIMKKTTLKRNEVYEMINSIHSELKFNGGGSIKDAIWALKKSNEMILTRIDGIEESQKVAMNIQGQAFWLSDKDGECSYASPALCKVYGHGESDIMGNNWIGWIVPDDRNRIFEAWQFSVENNTVFDEQFTVKRNDNTFQKVLSICFHKIVNDTYAGSIGKVEPVGQIFNN